MSVAAPTQTGLIDSVQPNLVPSNAPSISTIYFKQFLANSTSNLISSSFDSTSQDPFTSSTFDYKNFTEPFNSTEPSSIENLTDITSKPTSPSFDFDDPTDNSFIFYILILVFIIWNIYGLFIQVKLLFFTEPQASTNQFFDNCDLTTSYFKYMVRIRYTELINGYQLSNGTIMIDILDTKDRFITRLTVLPSWIVDRQKNPLTNQFEMVKFRLNRRFEMPEIGSIRITHDLYLPNECAIFIQNLQIKDLLNNKVINVPINRPIKALGPDDKFIEQCYEATKPIPIEPDEDMINDDVSSNVTITELLMFIFIYTNLTVMLTLVLKYFLKEHNTLQNLIMLCLLPTLASLLILICIIKLYQCYVKEKIILKVKTSNWQLVRVLFIIVCLNFSILMDLISFWIIIQLSNQFDNKFLISTFLSNILSIVFLILIYSLNQLKANKNLKTKQGSPTILSDNQTTKEKQSLNIAQDLFALKSSKDKDDS